MVSSNCGMTNQVKKTAKQRRDTAIQELVDRFIDPTTGLLVDVILIDEVAVAVEKLEILGRTEKWWDALARWQSMLRLARKADTDAEERRLLHWAILQGSVYASAAS